MPLARSKQDWQSYLLSYKIVSVKAVQVISEAALLGGVMAQYLSAPLRIISDGAGQFNILQHGLCWVHAEGGLQKLEGNTNQQRRNISEMQDLLWKYYRQLQEYQHQPTSIKKAELEQEFDGIFGRFYDHHVLLNNVLNQMRNHKAELLQVLDFPLFPLHNNAAETDIREYVTRRKISDGTRGVAGRKARDIFVGLKKTCRKLGILFWQYLMSRLHGDQQVPYLSDVIRERTAL